MKKNMIWILLAGAAIAIYYFQKKATATTTAPVNEGEYVPQSTNPPPGYKIVTIKVWQPPPDPDTPGFWRDEFKLVPVLPLSKAV